MVICAAAGVSADTATAAPTVMVQTFADFAAAVAEVDDGGEIVIAADIEMISSVTLPAGRTVSLASAGEQHTLTRDEAFTGPLFIVPPTSTATVTNLVLDGAGPIDPANPPNHTGVRATAALIDNRGDLTLAGGATLTSNWVYPPAAIGGGVSNSGSLTVLPDAQILDCWNGSYGGGAVQNEGAFSMSGGTLRGNTGVGGAIQNGFDATAVLTGGTIAGNSGAGGVTDWGTSGIENSGRLEVSGSTVVGDPSNPGSDNTVASTAPVLVPGPLTGHVSVAVDPTPTDGQVIATGTDAGTILYQLTVDDAARFSVRGYTTSLDVVQNAVVLTVPTPQLTALTADPESLGPEGGDVAVELSGTDLPSTFTVAAFDSATDPIVSATARTSGDRAAATLAFPENTGSSPRMYTIRASFDGMEWLAQPTATVTVEARARPTLADPDQNRLSAPARVTAGTAFSFVASGDRQDEQGIVAGDQRYIPRTWQINPSGAFAPDSGDYVGTATVSTPGVHTLVATFVQQAYDGSSWSDTPVTDTVSAEVLVVAPPTGPVPATGISVQPTSAVVPVGGTAQLRAQITPQQATDQRVRWDSAAPEIATVDDDGVVRGVSPGTVLITVSTADGGRTATAEITVTPADLSTPLLPVTGATAAGWALAALALTLTGILMTVARRTGRV